MEKLQSKEEIQERLTQYKKI